MKSKFRVRGMIWNDGENLSPEDNSRTSEAENGEEGGGGEEVEKGCLHRSLRKLNRKPVSYSRSEELRPPEALSDRTSRRKTYLRVGVSFQPSLPIVQRSG